MIGRLLRGWARKTLRRQDTRVIRLDPHIVTGMTRQVDSDLRIEARWRENVARNIPRSRR